MLTADMARDMSGDQKVTEALEYFECCIRKAAEHGFEVRRHVEFIGGVRQSPAFYAFW